MSKLWLPGQSKVSLIKSIDGLKQGQTLVVVNPLFEAMTLFRNEDGLLVISCKEYRCLNATTATATALAMLFAWVIEFKEFVTLSLQQAGYEILRSDATDSPTTIRFCDDGDRIGVAKLNLANRTVNLDVYETTSWLTSDKQDVHYWHLFDALYIVHVELGLP